MRYVILPQQRRFAVVAMRYHFGGQMPHNVHDGQGVEGLAPRAVQVHRRAVELTQEPPALFAVRGVVAVDLQHISPQQPGRVRDASPAYRQAHHAVIVHPFGRTVAQQPGWQALHFVGLQLTD